MRDSMVCEKDISGGGLETTKVQMSGGALAGTAYRIWLDGSDQGCGDVGSEGPRVRG